MQERTASSHRLGGKGNLVLRPIRLTRHLFLGPLGIAVGVLILWATFTLPSPTVLLVMADILQLATGAFFFLGGLLMVLLPWIKSARLELSGRRLIFSGLLRQTILDLNEWGKATVVQTSEGVWLAFFTLEEERALAAKGDNSKPGVFSATKTILVSPYIGNDIARAQEFADEVNSRRDVLAEDVAVADSDAVVARMKQRERRRHWIVFLIIMAMAIFAAFARRDIHSI